MSDAPERILAFRWPHGGRAWREVDMEAPVYASPYILVTPAALAASPEVAKLIREAEARGMERAAALSCSCGYDVPDNITFDEGQMFRAGAETALDAVSAMLRAEAAALKGE